MVEAREVSESSLGDQAYTTVEEVVGQVARYPMAANEQVLVSKVVGGSQVARNDVLSHILEGGMRGMAVRADVMVGAGGLVLPGDHVDVFWVPERVLEDHDGAGLVAENVEVIAVEQVLVELPAVAPGLTEDGQQPAGNPDDERIRGSEAEPIPDAATVTLMLTPEQAARIFCAELSGTLRLGVRAFGDESPSGLAPFTCALLADRETAQ
jgi:pilus assembly protein CpaB